tara:strand:- start:56 stop:655 length:600 start_codon:yes stop_codon:yes gene_type:complete
LIPNSLLYQIQKLFVLDKNHTVFENLEVIRNKIMSSSTNLIFYKNAFSKTKFMTKIMELFEIPIVYVDFDLLLSGYFESDSNSKPSNMEIIRPNTENLKNLLSDVLTQISSQRTVLILDSLNGLYSFLDDENPGRFVNGLIMLLHSNAKFSQSILFITCLAQKKDDNWVLPTGRHILESENINRFEINENNTKIKIKIA